MDLRNKKGWNDPFIRTCRQHGLKITPQRVAIYEEIVRSKSHPSADELFQNIRNVFPNISFDTVHRTLTTFYRLGMVDMITGKGGPRRFDSNEEPHHHFHCIQCGEIFDIENQEFDSLQVPERLQREFTILNKRVVLSGICARCKPS